MRFVISLVFEFTNGFRHFLYFLHFPRSNSSIEAEIGVIVLQTYLCQDKVFGINVLRLRLRFFAFVAAKMATQKSSLIKLKYGMHF